MNKLRNIRRIDNEVSHTHAWLVQVQRNYHISIKMFSDGVYGGKRKALKAATDFRSQIFSETNDYKYHMHRRTILRRNNKSGIPGVGRYENIENPNTGRLAIFWLAYWNDEHGVRRQRKFSVQHYGEQKAKQLAIAERKRKLKEVCTAKCV